MPADVRIYVDAACTQELPANGGDYVMDFGILNGDVGEIKEVQYWIKNIGDQTAENAMLSEQLPTTDPAKMAYWALDNAGVPGEYQAETLSLGNIAPGATVSVWVKVVVPAATSYVGNPRTIAIELEYWTI